MISIQEPTTPKLSNDSDFAIYDYRYCHDMYDKIYYAKGDENLKEDMLKHSSTTKANLKLAGDIKREFQIEDTKLLTRLQEMLTQHLSRYIRQPITEVNTINPTDLMPAWINYMKPGEYNPPHAHVGIFSFVWYLDIPEEIREEWKNSQGNVGARGCIQFFSQFVTNSAMHFSPQTNDLFLFSSKHQHQVYPYYSDNTRISLAGNIYEYK